MKRLAFVLGILCVATPVMAQGSVEQAVRAELEQRMASSGTLDIYDKDLNKVRNLDDRDLVITTEESDGQSVAKVAMRDKKRKQRVTVLFNLEHKDGALSVSSFSIDDIEDLPEEPKKEFTDADIQDAMKTALNQQSESNGKLVIYDINAQKLRHLQFLAFDPKVRRFGKLLISTVQYKDTENDADVLLDVTMEQIDNELTLKKTKIKKVSKK